MLLYYVAFPLFLAVQKVRGAAWEELPVWQNGGTVNAQYILDSKSVKNVGLDCKKYPESCDKTNDKYKWPYIKDDLADCKPGVKSMETSIGSLHICTRRKNYQIRRLKSLISNTIQNGGAGLYYKKICSDLRKERDSAVKAAEPARAPRQGTQCETTLTSGA
ncbi:MAG: hypothetical protein Q9227_003824 [Pyrenula ochraceoflavens]